MKIKFILLIILSILRSEDLRIHLITTNDLHGSIAHQKAHFMNPHHPPKLGGWSAYYRYVKELKKEITLNNEGLLILDGGNFFQGHPIGLVDGGKSIIEWMNLIGYNALVPGRYDFILGSENLIDLSDLAEFPFLGSNLKANTKNLKPYIIVNAGGVKVGVLGIVPSNLDENVLEQNLSKVKITREIDALEKWIPELKQAGAEMIIVLASTGVPWDRDDVYENFIDTVETFDPRINSMNSLQLGYYSKGADIIVSGGESKGYKMPWYDKNSHVYIFQNYGNGTEFGHIILKVDKQTHLFKGFETVIAGRTSQSLLMDDLSVDSDAYILISDLKSRALNKIYKQHLDIPLFEVFDYSEIEDVFDIPSIQKENELEVITWNCEFFPKSEEKTIKSLAEAVHDLDADIIGFQEIRRRGWFDNLMSYLPDYSYMIAQQSSFMDNAIIYKKDRISLVNMIEPFAEDDYNFAGRPPLQGNFKYNFNNIEFDFTIINIHMKCCDSGLLRRKRAAKELYEYSLELLKSNQDKIIILGDWNDDLRDRPGEHCFDPFLSDPQFYFANTPLLDDDKNVTYPKEPYRSFLDHILITSDFLNPQLSYRVETLPVEKWFGSYENYEYLISDHKPVMVGIPLP